MTTLRHGEPLDMEGWMQKDRQIGGGMFRSGRLKRYLCLRNSILSSHHDERSPASWELSVVNCPVSEGPGKWELCIVFPYRRMSFYALTEDSYNQWREAFKAASSRSVQDHYELGKTIGKGACAEVKLCSDRSTKEEFAIKIMRKDFHPQEIEYILREQNIMKSVVHPNIITTYDIFDTSRTLYIVLELMKGGELFDVIAREGFFSEKRASEVTRDIVSGVAYLHMHSIVHRDIKPENVLCKNKTWPYQVKLADFGLANYLYESERDASSKNLIGTIPYLAPEVVNRQRCGSPVDMWACGVVLFILLSGKMPFFGRSDHEIMTMITSGHVEFPDREWQDISSEAKSLVRSLLQSDPDKRLTAKACLHHTWLVSDEVSNRSINNDRSGIHSSRRKFRAAAYAAMSAAKISHIASLALEAKSEPQNGGP